MTGPPGILIFAAVFEAGLATGLLHSWVPALAGMVLWTWGRRRADPVVLAAGFAVAAVTGSWHAAASTQRCDRQWRRGPMEVRVRVVEPGAGMVRAGVVGMPCHGEVLLVPPRREVESESWRAGELRSVEGRWLPGDGTRGRAGRLLVNRTRVEAFAPSMGDRIRRGIAETVARRFPERAAMVNALVLGRRSDLDPGLRAAFAASGLAHLLAISGFHVGLVAAWVFLLGRLLVKRIVWAASAAALVAGAYVALLGWPVPATRAALLVLLVTWGRLRQRRLQPFGVLAASAVLITGLDPDAITDAGAWLSFTAVAGTVAAGRWCDRAGIAHAAARAAAGSMGATLATAPVTAAVFGSIPLIGVPLNLVAIPLAAAAVPGLFATIALDRLVPPLAQRWAEGTNLLLRGLEILAHLGARLPGGQVVVEPGPAALVPPLLALAALAWVIAFARATRREALRRGAWVIALAAWIPLGNAGVRALGRADRGLTLHFLDVGQGDAAVLRTPGGRWFVIDAGPRTDRWDAGRSVVVPFLRRRGAERVDGLVVSHAHLDHLGGVPAVLDRFDPAWIVEPAVPVDDPVYGGFLDAVAEVGDSITPARPGVSWTVDGVRFVVLHPDTARVGWGLDLNEDSVVLLVEYGAFRALFAGDAGFPTEADLRGKVGRVAVLKVGHHGSRTATSAEWLAELQPAAAVISVGANRFGHPTPAALERLRHAGAGIWRTDQDGTITVTTDGRTGTIAGRGRRQVLRLSDHLHAE